MNPQTWNGYSYTYNSPLKYTDPTGEAPDGRDVLDFFLGVAKGAGSAISLGTAPGSEPSPSDSTASLTGQVLGAAIVGVTEILVGGTEAVITSPAAVTVVGAVAPAAGARVAAHGLTGIAVSFAKIDQEAIRRGLANEERTLRQEGLAKNTKRIEAVDPKTGEKGTTIPDSLTGGRTSEVKDRARVTDSEQPRRQSEISERLGGRAQVLTGKRTKVSKTVRERMDVRRRKHLGPQEEDMAGKRP